MSSQFPSRNGVFLVSASTAIIIFAIVITAVVQSSSDKTFSQIITVGPVWNTDSWSCTSDRNFTIDGSLRALGSGSQLTIGITGIGTQSFYELSAGQLETFSVGVPADQTITITRTGIVTGFITLQTTSDANASCTQV